MQQRHACLCAAALALSALVPARASDAPQFRGPTRDGLYPDTGLLAEWPEGGPPLRWKKETLGQSFAQVICVAGVVYATGDIGEDLVVTALNAATGDELWRRKIAGQAWTNPGNWPAARTTPTYDPADGGRLYLVGGQGAVACLSAKDGEGVWKRDLAEFGGRSHHWGFAESPLVTDTLCVVTPGGKKTMVALDKATGKTVWESEGADLPAHYCSAIAVNVGGQTLAVNGTGRGLVGVGLADGKVAFTNDAYAGNTANCPAPVFRDGMLFWAVGYRGGGAVAIDLSVEGGRVVAKERYRAGHFNVKHGGYVWVGDHVYGVNERANLLCIRAADGQAAWTQANRQMAFASTIFADGRLYVLSESGHLFLVDADPAKFTQRGYVRLPGSGKSWAYPTIADKRLFVRFGQNGDTLYCYDLAAR